MKKKIIVSLSIATIAIGQTAAAAPAVPELTKNYYPDTMIVSDLDYEKDLVTLADATGNIWTFAGCEDWMIGDLAALIMDDMGTENIFDDQIVSIKYSGYYDTKILASVVSWEATDTGILLSFEDGTGYYIEK